MMITLQWVCDLRSAISFKKNYEDAKKIMLLIHNQGKGICGVFPLDIAETKANQVVEFARINQHPLECKVQKQ